MDIERDPPKHRLRNALIVAGFTVLVGITVALTSLGPAVQDISRDAIAIDTVSIGDMVRDIRAPGTLVPEHVRLIVATTGGRVEALPVKPGDVVQPGSTIVQLANPDVALAALQMEQQLTQAMASLAQLRSAIMQQRATQQGNLAQLRTQSLDAQRSQRVLDDLDRAHSASRNEVAAAHERAEEMATRLQLEQRRAQELDASGAEQLQYQEEQIAGLKRIVAEHRDRAASMRVVAGEAGQLQSLGSPTLELGQWVNSGYELARISQPGRLKAVLRVPETQVRDIANGMAATIDTRDGVVPGHVTSIDPTSRGGSVAVEVTLDGPLPRGARADLAVDGAIVLERLHHVLHVGRPAYGSAESEVRLFKIVPNTGEAQRVNVRVGRTSVTSAEIRQGLAVGDSVIISDMTQSLPERRIGLRNPK